MVDLQNVAALATIATFVLVAIDIALRNWK